MKKKYLLLMLVGCLILASCAKNEKQNTEQKAEKKTEEKTNNENISLFAAASLEESLAKIIPEFEKENNVKVDVNLASSGKLQKQIEQKAPCDVFVSAGQKQVKALEEKELVKDSKSLLKNKLVIVKNKETDVT
ncbi:MAG: molybdate ABC transporter substrate-binding protein, partial [Klebsiella michiganensis]|nr:molybdate ABC transporter substrate-binding protein [Klebsiella michiganensis]